MWSEIKSLKWSQGVTILFIALGFFGPGILIIYLYKPDLLIELDAIKLSIFSSSITLPVLTLNLIVIHIYCLEAGINDKTVISAFSALATFLIFYPSILIAYFFALSFKGLLLCLLILFLIIIVLPIVLISLLPEAILNKLNDE